MKVLLAPDKFKGSLSAQNVCEALAKGLKRVNPKIEIISRPMADGGDGSLEVLAHYFNLETITTTVHDPLFRPIDATYKMTGKTAYIEMSAASGLVLLTGEERDCRKTTSLGTGELILHAIRRGATEIYLFIGGSATNDGGIGIASALGWSFYDKNEVDLVPIGENLRWIKEVDGNALFYNPEVVDFKVICDVNNPLYGKNGAAYVYATQKGATAQDLNVLDKGLRNLAKRLKEENYPDIANIPGAGAAGGVGGGAIAFLNAALKSGIHTFLEITKLETLIKDCDLVITGEGKLDAQTEQGKVISGVCALAKKYDKRIMAVCGTAEEEEAFNNLGLEQVYTVLEKSKSVEEAMSKAAEKLEEIGMDILTF